MNQPSARMAKSRECSDNDNDKDQQDDRRVPPEPRNSGVRIQFSICRRCGLHLL